MDMLQFVRFDIKGECHVSVERITALRADDQPRRGLSQKVLPFPDFKVYLQPLLRWHWWIYGLGQLD
jgi:hypothetical protein